MKFMSLTVAAVALLFSFTSNATCTPEDAVALARKAAEAVGEVDTSKTSSVRQYIVNVRMKDDSLAKVIVNSTLYSDGLQCSVKSVDLN